MVDTFTDLVERWSNSDMRAERAAAFFGVLVGVVADTHQEAATLCARMHLLDDPNSPDDILPVIATDRKLERYYLETPAQHRARLIDAWEIYKGGGSAEAIETQLRAAGFGPTDLLGEWGNPDVEWGEEIYFWGDLGAFVQFRNWELGPRGEAAPYWSMFWVVFSPGFHPVTGPPTPWGEFEWGFTGEWAWRNAGYSLEFHRTILSIAKKFKDSRYVLRGFHFMVHDIPWGDEDVDWGDATIIWGGQFAVPVPLS